MDNQIMFLKMDIFEIIGIICNFETVSNIFFYNCQFGYYCQFDIGVAFDDFFDSLFKKFNFSGF